MSRELYGRIWTDGYSPTVTFDYTDGVLTATVKDIEGEHTGTLFTVEQELSEESENPIASSAIWDAVHSASLHTHDNYDVLEAITSAPLPLSGGTMTGAVILYGGSTVATSPTAGDDSAKIATTEWVQDEIATKADLEDLTDGSVTKLGTSTVGSASTPVYWNNGTPSAVSSISASLIGSGAITTARIADSAVTSAKLASGVAVANIGYTPQAKHSTTTATLASGSWSSKTQTVSVTGVTASNTVIVSPAPASYTNYVDAEIRCTSQTSGKLTFTCTTTPSSNVTVNVLILGV